MKRKNGGFTLTELVIVIAVIAVLAAIFIPTFSSVVANAKRTADVQQMRQLNIMLFTGEISESELKEYSLQTSDWELAYSEQLNAVVIVDSEHIIVASADQTQIGKVATNYIRVSELADENNGGGEGQDPDGSQDPDDNDQDPDGGGEGQDPDGSQDADWWQSLTPITVLPDKGSAEYEALMMQAEIHLDVAIPTSYFSGNTNLQRIYLSEAIIALPNDAFNGCTLLQEVIMAGEVTSLGARAFRNCAQLATLSLPYLTSMGSSAFASCEFETLEIGCTDGSATFTSDNAVFKVKNLHIARGTMANANFSAWVNKIITNGNSVLESIRITETDLGGASKMFDGAPSNLTVYIDQSSCDSFTGSWGQVSLVKLWE